MCDREAVSFFVSKDRSDARKLTSLRLTLKRQSSNQTKEYRAIPDISFWSARRSTLRRRLLAHPCERRYNEPAPLILILNGHSPAPCLSLFALIYERFSTFSS